MDAKFAIEAIRRRVGTVDLEKKAAPMERDKDSSRSVNLAPGIAGVIVALFVALGILTSHSTLKQFGTESDPLGPWFVPWLSAGGILLGSLVVAVNRNSDAYHRALVEEHGKLSDAKIWIGLSAMVVYVWILPYLGFYIASALLVGVFTSIFQLSWRTAVLVGISMDLFAYLLFIRLLHVLLPGWPM